MAQDSPHILFQVPHRQFQVHRSRIIGKSKIPRIPSLALGKKGEPVKIHELEPYLKKKKKYIYTKEKILVYSVQYLHNRPPGTWTRTHSKASRNHGPGLRKEKRKVIYQKKKKEEGNISKRKADSHTKKLEAVLKHKQKKKGRAVFKKKLIQPQIVYINLK